MIESPNGPPIRERTGTSTVLMTINEYLNFKVMAQSNKYYKLSNNLESRTNVFCLQDDAPKLFYTNKV